MASDPILVYGATGFTGERIVHEMCALGLRPVLGGRDESKLRALAASRDLEWRAARLDDAAALDAALRDMRVVLHAAGPHALAEIDPTEGMSLLDFWPCRK